SQSFTCNSTALSLGRAIIASLSLRREQRVALIPGALVRRPGLAPVHACALEGIIQHLDCIRVSGARQLDGIGLHEDLARVFLLLTHCRSLSITWCIALGIRDLLADHLVDIQLLLLGERVV